MDKGSSSYKRLRERIEEHAKEHADFCMLEDGYYYFFPERNVGAISSHELRILADILDDMNKEWNETVETYFNVPEEADQAGATERGQTAPQPAGSHPVPQGD